MKQLKTALLVVLCFLAVLFLLAAGYIIYLFASYDRLEDSLPLEMVSNSETSMAVDQPASITTWNLGFGAYSDDYSFFMDGGKESRARSPEAVHENFGGALRELQAMDSDLMLLQEIDLDATRSHHIDQRALALEAFPAYDSGWAQNYDSAYLFYPFNSPHGASKAGELTLSKAAIESGIRRSLPIETGMMKFFDLDRCYSVSRIPTDNGKTLCLYNLHLSAYTSDGSIATEQLELLLSDMQQEYDAGNYVIAGGDFNKDLPGNSSEIFGVSGEIFTWAQPLPKELIPEAFTLVDSTLTQPLVPSCRNADSPYVPGESYVLTVDGFIVSDNVEVLSIAVRDMGFRYSDHNPVHMEFRLIP